MLRELVVLDDLSLVVGGPVAHPDPSEVIRTLTQKTGRENAVKTGDSYWRSSVLFQVAPLIPVPGFSAANTVAAGPEFSLLTCRERTPRRSPPTGTV